MITDSLTDRSTETLARSVSRCFGNSVMARRRRKQLHSPGQRPRVVSPNSHDHCGQEFWAQTRRERRGVSAAIREARATKSASKRTAAQRVAPNLAYGFVAPQSQSSAAMLPRRALPQAKLGATMVMGIRRHHTSGVDQSQLGLPAPRRPSRVAITPLRAKIHKKMLEFLGGDQVDDFLEGAVSVAVGLFDRRGRDRIGGRFVNKGRGGQRAVNPFA